MVADVSQSQGDEQNDKVSQDEPGGLSSRSAALKIISSVLDKGQAFDHVLEADSAFHALDIKDRAFVRMMVATLLRRLGQIDDLITQIEDCQSTKTPALQNILRLGVVQIMFMAVADHAAVDTAVRLCDDHGYSRQKGFVNAVLRNIARQGPALLAKQDEVRLNTPEWLLKTWIADYGLGEAAEIARANLQEASLDITIKNEADRNHYASVFKATELLTGTLRKSTGGRVQDLDGFDKGDWWVQDASAAIPAQLFGELKGKVVVDLCAAPGGKSVQLASRGADVVALDRSAKRLKRVEENAARLGLSEKIEIHVADAAAWQPPGSLQYILLDAPCSATGTVRRHPDVLHLKSERDISRLADTQTRILNNAFEILAVGGVLVFCTCSLQKDEGERRIEAFLARYENAARVPISAKDDLNGYDESLTDLGDLRILPHHQASIGGMDGFFISRLTKLY
ncbi:MAG: RsmB/NOP family class I SAM-dependent RNA methyltransferase [Bdellovibrionales bacterium]